MDDNAALVFARAFYEAFLSAGPQSAIREAVRLARCEAMKCADTANTWGAYQHYGNPEFRILRTV